MAGRIKARVPRGESRASIHSLRTDDELEPFLADAAHYPGGHSPEIYFPHSEAEVADLVRGASTLLCIGAQSSLTGGATPRGEVLISTRNLSSLEFVSSEQVTVGAGVILSELAVQIGERGAYYPPVPTFDGATVGGTVATNAAGAATFKYGTTRDWIDGLTVVLASGEVLDIERGAVTTENGHFVIEAVDGRERIVPVPTYTMPNVAKCSAGYYTRPTMDLIDLFIGAEGTLGVVVEARLRVLPARPEWFCLLVPARDDAEALALTTTLRERSLQTWEAGRSDDVDIAAIEYVDRHGLGILREDRSDHTNALSIGAGAGAALFIQAEVDAGIDREAAFAEISEVGNASTKTSIGKICETLLSFDLFDRAFPVLPGDDGRRRDLFSLREAVPDGVNRRVREAQRTVDRSISKSSGDVIVPFNRFAEALVSYRRTFERFRLEHAIWGHFSDGNVHPNALARTREQMQLAKKAQLEIGRTAIHLGGAPMSEHGVGRNPNQEAATSRPLRPRRDCRDA